MCDKRVLNPEAPCFVPGGQCPSEHVPNRALVRFNDCYHIGIPKEVDFHGPTLDCPICAFSYEGQRSAGEKGRTMWNRLTMIIDDAHPYYGDDTIIRFYCAHLQRHGQCTCERLDETPRHSCTNKVACSQYFFATANDFKACYAPEHFKGLARCDWAHQSRAFPIYNCLVALEILTREHFDFPIPVRGGMRAGFNPTVNLVVICANDVEDRERQEKRVAETFAHLGDRRPWICAIYNAEVRAIWSGEIPANRRDRVAATECADRIISLGKFLLRAPKFAPFVREFSSNDGRRQILIARIQEGRVLTADCDVSNTPDSIRHYVNREQFATGISGLPPPIRDPYKRMDSVRVQKRKWLAQQKHESKFADSVNRAI